MRDALQIQDPEWDISPGSPEWKVLEAVAQQIENLTFNSVLNDFHFDVDKKSGLELDLFMSLFGYSRIRAKRATGEVTFSRGTAATFDYVIPLGTQVFVPATDFNPAIYFQTTISAVLATGDTEVSVPVQSVIGGTIGNVGTGAVSGMASTVGGVTSVTNLQAITGGRDAEADSDLRDRWRATVFRNISGTEDQFLGLIYNESAFVHRANLVGPIERYSEQLQLIEPEDLTTSTPWEALVTAGTTTTTLTVSAGTKKNLPIATLADTDSHFYAAISDGDSFFEIVKVTNRASGSGTLTVVRASSPVDASTINRDLFVVFPSSVPDSKYTYPPGGEVVGLDIGLTTQQVGRRGDIIGLGDYQLITTHDGLSSLLTSTKIVAGAATPMLYVTATGAQSFGLGSIVQVESEYTPLSSRNEPADHVAEKVDLFHDGEDPLTITEQIPYRTDYTFGDNLTETDFLRDDGVNEPVAPNRFIQLSKSPVVSVPSSITVPATTLSPSRTYYKDEDYWLVDDKTNLEGSPRAQNGIEWKNSLSVDDNAAYAAGVFSASAVAGGGNLNGWYSYVITYEVDGQETLSISDTPEGPGVTNSGSFGKNNLTIPLYVPGPAHSVIWRRVYRSVSSATQNAADAGPFYLLKVIRDNTTVAFADNKSDDALDTDVQPPKAEPDVDSTLSIEYSYNALTERLDAQVDLVRLVGMDTLVHVADVVQLKFNLAVVVVAGMNPTDLKADINTNLDAWINRKTFQNNVQVADVIDVVSNAAGVDNVRLARETEARNEVQKVTVTLPASPSTTRDKFTLTIGGVTSGSIVYNDTQFDVREKLEAMPNIHEGNTFATVTQDGGALTSNDTVLTVTNNPSLRVGNINAGAPLSGFYFQIDVDAEIMYVESVVDNTGTLDWTIRRAQLNTTAASHTDGGFVHVLGDVAVTRETLGSPIEAYVYNVYFLPNGYTGVNDWGTRELDNMTASKATENSQVTLAVAEKVSGAGWGIQRIALNDMTIISGDSDPRFVDGATLDDIYLSSDELPTLFAVDVVVKAQNTF